MKFLLDVKCQITFISRNITAYLYRIKVMMNKSSFVSIRVTRLVQFELRIRKIKVQAYLGDLISLRPILSCKILELNAKYPIIKH